VGENAPDNLISVIMPAFNAGKYITKSIGSVRNQSHRELEIIVVDDGSTDDTVAIVEAQASQDKRIRLLRSPHRGVSHARNLAIAQARGSYIAPIDADDLWKRDKLKRQYQILSTAPKETGVVYAWAAGIDDEDKIVLPVWNASQARGDVLHAIVESGILSCGSTPLIRKGYAQEVGGYDEELHLSEDWKFYTALAGVCHFEVIPECLIGYRIRNDSASVNIEPMEEALEACTRWIRKTWPDLPKHVLAERDFTLNTYLAFMATRGGQYARVPRYLTRAVGARPGKLFGVSLWQFAALAIAHAAGLRRYEWALWRRPQKFEQ
jgi:glycosyltransferase involved in cell wall biosynthesis